MQQGSMSLICLHNSLSLNWSFLELRDRPVLLAAANTLGSIKYSSLEDTWANCALNKLATGQLAVLLPIFHKQVGTVELSFKIQRNSLGLECCLIRKKVTHVGHDVSKIQIFKFFILSYSRINEILIIIIFVKG